MVVLGAPWEDSAGAAMPLPRWHLQPSALVVAVMAAATASPLR
jgi:hypothetical protein